MTSQVRIAFRLPGNPAPFYFRRDEPIVVDGVHTTRPEVTPDALQAHKFNPESALMFRDHWREKFRDQGFTITVEDLSGTTLFERETPTPNQDTEDRQPLWFVPDDRVVADIPIELMSGFLVVSGIRPDEGRCWYVRARDIPTMTHRTDLESVFGRTPAEAVERARALWGSLAQPYDHPRKEQYENKEVQHAMLEIQRIKQGPGRRRPGDLA